MTAGPGIAVVLGDVTGDEGRAVLREYFHDIVARYHGHPAGEAEITALMAADPSDRLAPPHGFLLVARRTGPDGTDRAVGCAGLALLDGGIGEVKRVFVRPEARGQGLGARLMTELERLAVAHGRHTLRLDTRADLVEARRLYLRLGYQEVPAFSTGPYCDHWYAKSLEPAPPTRARPGPGRPTIGPPGPAPSSPAGPGRVG